MGRLIEASSEYFTRGNKSPINGAGCRQFKMLDREKKNQQHGFEYLSLLNNSAKI